VADREGARERNGRAEFSLGNENHRSPDGGILQFADGVLRNRRPLPVTSDVKTVPYWPNGFGSTVHATVLFTFSALAETVESPCVTVLCRRYAFVAELSAILSEERAFNDRRLPPIHHDVVWDVRLSAAAATVLALKNSDV
jgi:DNA helicase II / ATP-dependent DNA helicase PcrA